MVCVIEGVWGVACKVKKEKGKKERYKRDNKDGMLRESFKETEESEL